MNSHIEENLGRGLRELADAPAPVGLADRALHRARRARLAAAVGSGSAAVVAALAVAAPFVFSGDERDQAPPAAALPSPGGDCAPLPSLSPDRTGGAQKTWPDFVRVAVERLPAGGDYALESAYGPCHPADVKAPNAYAVVTIGPDGADGRLTIRLDDGTWGENAIVSPTTCSQANQMEVSGEGRAAGKLVFCEEATAQSPIVYGIEAPTRELTVLASLDDGRTAWVSSHPATVGGPSEVSPDDLRDVVTQLLRFAPTR
ncbi:hypothetical protein [Micromonospora sp. URMC 103]|uniref:hypothetical protein n=1 Tax=Micromonospora sp. URMC 103 TaxID=3423406 RepID=UPI003F1BBA0E